MCGLRRLYVVGPNHLSAFRTRRTHIEADLLEGCFGGPHLRFQTEAPGPFGGIRWPPDHLAHPVARRNVIRREFHRFFFSPKREL
jgi:hypothetical protein